jgi:hypothetical protein
LVITIKDAAHGSVVYDPTASDACIVGHPSNVSLTQNSPIFQTATGRDEWAPVYRRVGGGGCGFIGAIDLNEFDARNADAFNKNSGSISVEFSDPFYTRGSERRGRAQFIWSCCVLGYHRGYNSGGQLQGYSLFAYSSNFSGDVSTFAHELAEAVMDPTGNNPAPSWGDIGQQAPAARPTSR